MESKKTLISIRLDDSLIAKLKALAAKEGIGYQTLISEVLMSYVGDPKSRVSTITWPEVEAAIAELKKKARRL